MQIVHKIYCNVNILVIYRHEKKSYLCTKFLNVTLDVVVINKLKPFKDKLKKNEKINVLTLDNQLVSTYRYLF